MRTLRQLFPNDPRRRGLFHADTAVAITSSRPGSRGYRRIPLKRWIKIVIQDPERSATVLSVRAINVSGSGVLIEASRPLEVGTLVYFCPKRVNLVLGNTYVRRCNYCAGKYSIALEFRTKLNHSAPQPASR
jgi:hypothetical protein